MLSTTSQAGVRASWGTSFSTYTDNNVLATQLMLETAKTEGVDAFVYASSSSVYGDTDVFPMQEDAKCRPFSPYGVTKLAADRRRHGHRGLRRRQADSRLHLHR